MRLDPKNAMSVHLFLWYTCFWKPVAVLCGSPKQPMPGDPVGRLGLDVPDDSTVEVPADGTHYEAGE